jgi:hypothetical protein
LGGRQLVGLLNTVYIKNIHINNISKVKDSVYSVGKLGAGNKGSIGIRFRLYENTFCFVTAHLAAGQKEKKVEVRNENFHTIMKNMVFEDEETTINIDEHDFIYFYGDLNYRINLDFDKVVQLVEKRDLDTLLENDQLLLEHKKENVLKDFSEPKIKFNPTYKYDPGIEELIFDTSEKRRTPSWCDRIFYKCKYNNLIKNTKYDTDMRYTISDHKPVCGLFKVSVNQVEEKWETISLNQLYDGPKIYQHQLLDNLELPVELINPLYYDHLNHLYGEEAKDINFDEFQEILTNNLTRNYKNEWIESYNPFFGEDENILFYQDMESFVYLKNIEEKVFNKFK